MYVPPLFKEDLAVAHALIRASGLGLLVTHGTTGLVASPLPFLLESEPTPNGALIGHMARANNQWETASPTEEALAIFTGPDAYISPSWYATKKVSGKVVPTWNYVSVHAYGKIEFFHDPERLLDAVNRLTRRHEEERPAPWAVGDAPADFVAGQLRAIVGFRLVIDRLEAKSKMSQNRTAEDRAGVAAGLAESDAETDRIVAGLIKP